MAYDSTQQLPGHSLVRVRRMDTVEAVLRNGPKRGPGRHRIRVHGAVRKTRSAYSVVRACVILGVTTPTVAAALGALLQRGHW
jgi:hypothetical protein